MTDSPLVPKGVSHGADLSGMTSGERQRHHTRQLRQVAFYEGKTGVDAYKQRHPDAARHRVNLTALAYDPKPAGYGEAIANMVDHWFDSDSALASTNGADVDRLNAKLEIDRFDRRNHFSKPLPPAVRKRLADLFSRRGASLPSSAKSMSAVRQAVRSFKAGERQGGQPFGAFGIRVDDTLMIGGRSFAVSRNGNRECIWLTGDRKRRLYLDDILAIGELIGQAPVAVSDNLLGTKIRDRHYSPETADPPPPAYDASERSSLTDETPTPATGDRHCGDDEASPPSRHDLELAAAARLAAAHTAAEAADCDILDL